MSARSDRIILGCREGTNNRGGGRSRHGMDPNLIASTCQTKNSESAQRLGTCGLDSLASHSRIVQAIAGPLGRDQASRIWTTGRISPVPNKAAGQQRRPAAST